MPEERPAFTNPKHSQPAPVMKRLLLLGIEGAFGWEMRQQTLQSGREFQSLCSSRTITVPGSTPSPLVDLAKPDTYARYLEGMDAVIDCAGLAAWGKVRNPRRHGEHTLLQVQRLLSAAKSAGVKRVVLLGDANWFAGRDPEAEVKLGNKLCARGYGRALAPIWDEIRSACLVSGLGVRVHAGRIYGWGSWFVQEVVNPLKYQGRAYLVGEGANWLSPVYSRDLADALLLAAEKGLTGRDYLATAEPIRLRDFVRMSAHYMGFQLTPRVRAFWHARLRQGVMSAENEIISCRASSAVTQSELGWVLRFPTLRDGLPTALKDLGVLAWK